MAHCEFCGEFAGRGQPRFAAIYGTAVGSRVVAASESFVALPTLGQLFTGSLLALPTEHLEMASCLDAERLTELDGFLKQVKKLVGRFGRPIFFEHGSTSERGGSCGIYHAHVHVVPVPWEIDINVVFPEATGSASSLTACLGAVRGSNNYLWISDGSRYAYRSVGEGESGFPSQFFRRRIADAFDVRAPWDWRTYTAPEQALTQTLAVMRRRVPMPADATDGW